MAATNRLEIVDPALLRPGRFDLLVETPPPDKKARIEILRAHTRGKPLTDDLDLEALADMTDGTVGADIHFICTRASVLAIRKFLNRGIAPSELSELKIDMEDFREAALDMKSKFPCA